MLYQLDELFLAFASGGDGRAGSASVVESDNAASNSGSQKAETRGPMLDLFLAQRANMRGKQLLAVETPEEQCNPLESASPEKVQFVFLSVKR